MSEFQFVEARAIVYRIYITSRNRLSIIGINDPKSDLALSYPEHIFATKYYYPTKELAARDLKKLYLASSPKERELRFAPDMLAEIEKVQEED